MSEGALKTFDRFMVDVEARSAAAEMDAWDALQAEANEPGLTWRAALEIASR